MFTLNIQRPRTYGAFVVAIGFAIALSAPWLIVAAADTVRDKTVFAIFDDSVTNWLIQNRTDAADIACRFISLFGDWMLAVVVAAAVVRLSFRKRVPHLATLFIATGGAVLLNLMLEYTFRRAHSVTANEFVTVAQGISFPSGHSMISVVVYGILAYFATLSTRLPKPRQMVSVGGAAMIIVLIGLARVYLGVHTVSDVVLGCVAGVLWLAACIIGHPMLAASVAKARLTPSSTIAVVEPLASN